MGTPGPSGFSVAQSAQLLMPRASFSVEGAWGAYVGSGRIVARLIVETARGRLLDTPTRDLPQRSGAGGMTNYIKNRSTRGVPPCACGRNADSGRALLRPSRSGRTQATLLPDHVSNMGPGLELACLVDEPINGSATSTHPTLQ
jgi:hypothetical protein